MWLVGALVVGLVSSLAPSMAASTAATTVVTAEVLSATNLNVAACGTGLFTDNQFGQLQPGTNNTIDSCSVVFGSSNDTSMLRAYQTDGAGDAMWSMSPAIDTSFGGGDGIGDDVDASGSNANDTAQDMALLADGSALVAVRANGGATGNDFAAVKFTPTGALDTTWGGGDGVSDIIDAGGTSGGDVPYAISVFPDESFILSGYGASGAGDFVAVKYLANGSLDTGYGGGDGISDRVDIGGSDEATDAHILDDGGLLLTGNGWPGATTYDYFAVKLTASGSLDTTWGGGDGISDTVDASTGVGNDDWATSSALLDDGSFIISGTGNGVGNQQDFVAVKYVADGSVDTGFGGGDGVTPLVDVTGTNGYEWGTYAEGIVVLPDNSFIITGEADWGAGNVDFGAVKFTATGGIDTTWGGGDGIVTIDAGGVGQGDTPGATHLLTDGRLVISGRADTGPNRFAFVVLDAAGNIESAWGSAGISDTVDASGNGSNLPSSSIITSDGRVVMAGTINPTLADQNVTVVQFGSTVVQQYSGTNDWASAAPNDDFFGACLASVAGGAAATGGSWALDTNATAGDCDTDDADPWNPISATSGGASAKVAESTVSGTITAQTDISFGFRTAGNQAAGKYLAPITFEAVAPNV